MAHYFGRPPNLLFLSSSSKWAIFLQTLFLLFWRNFHLFTALIEGRVLILGFNTHRTLKSAAKITEISFSYIFKTAERQIAKFSLEFSYQDPSRLKLSSSKIQSIAPSGASKISFSEASLFGVV